MKPKRYLLLTIACLISFFPAPSAALQALPIGEKSRLCQVEILAYLRELRSMVLNFPCAPFPECQGPQVANKQEFLKQYQDTKKVYQEGLIYYYEGNYLNAYGRFVQGLDNLDMLLEELSQSYLARARYMMREAIEKKNPQDPDDISATNIFVEYGPKSYRRKTITSNRESPRSKRDYKAKEYNWIQIRHRLDGNMKKGYEHFALAQKARLKAFKVIDEEKLAKDNRKGVKRISFDQRRRRVSYYLASIRLARLAKANAGYIFALKYPYDTYALQNPFGKTEKGRFDAAKVPVIENVRMNWSENPYVSLYKLHPIFDLRVPPEFRRDLVDIRGEAYDEVSDKLLRLKYSANKPASYEVLSEVKTQSFQR